MYLQTVKHVSLNTYLISYARIIYTKQGHTHTNAHKYTNTQISVKVIHVDDNDDYDIVCFSMCTRFLTLLSVCLLRFIHIHKLESNKYKFETK